jgi:UDP-glucose 4-epimerase
VTEARRSVLVTAVRTPLDSAVVAALRRDPRVGSVVCAHEPGATPPDPIEGVRYVAADLGSYRGVHDLLFGEQARHLDTIVHAPLHEDPLSDGARVSRLNVDSTRHLLALAAERASLRRFVFRSSADVYRIDSDEPVLIDEDHPLELSPSAPAGVRSRVEADLTVCERIAGPALAIAVLRCAEVLAPRSGSRLYDYLSSRVCLRPLGYDPIINVLSPADAAHAIALAATSDAAGIFNIPGRDALPLSELIHRTGRIGLAVPGPALGPLYVARAALTAGRFRYALDERRFHHSGVLDGRRARAAFRYVPEHALDLGALFQSTK